MGIAFCSDKEKSSGGKRPSFNLAESPHKKIVTVSDTEIPSPFNSTAKSSNVDDVKTNPTKPIWLQPPQGGTAMSYSNELGGHTNRIRNNTDPLQPALVAYSSRSNVLKQTMLVDDELLEALSAKPQAQVAKPTTQRLSLSRKSVSYIQKRHRLNEDVIIHKVTHGDEEGPVANPEMYKLVIALREVWIKLDLDEDNFLNLSELTRFCKQIWEEPVEDGGAKKIMEVYAKEHPEKGISFREWCILIKEEDPDLRDFVEEIYDIFVDPASQFVT